MLQEFSEKPILRIIFQAQATAATTRRRLNNGLGTDTIVTSTSCFGNYRCYSRSVVVNKRRQDQGTNAQALRAYIAQSHRRERYCHPRIGRTRPRGLQESIGGGRSTEARGRGQEAGLCSQQSGYVPYSIPSRFLIGMLCTDLIPKDNAQLWLKHLRHSTPTLPFLSPSSAQHQRTNISSGTAPALIRLLKAYKPKASSVTIGVVGYPNVGKSSLINSLKRSKVTHFLSSFLLSPNVSVGMRRGRSTRPHKGTTVSAARAWNAHC